MANKQINIKQLDNNNGYDTLYPQTTATQTVLSDKTSTSFGGSNVTVDSALNKIIKKLQTDKKILVKVVDEQGNPVQGAKINGLLNSPVTGSNGTVNGVFVSDPLTIISPCADLNDVNANGASYVGSTNVLTVTLPIAGENGIKRFTSSKTVKFSKMVKTVDVCCVGGGGGGGNIIIISGSPTRIYSGGGGGGGAVVNSYGKSINADTDYVLSIGSGGASGTTGGTGGTTTFLSVSAVGGGGAYGTTSGMGGKSGSVGSGDGGNAGQNGQNSTVTEFDDGATFYCGGGGGGDAKGGTPYGADGAYVTGSSQHSATTPGIGGGGGGGAISADLPSAGGSGLVAIRFHF